MKTLLFTLLISCYSFAYTQSEYVKVTNYESDGSTIVTLKTKNGPQKFVVLEQKHFKAIETRTKADYQKYLNVQGNDSFYLKKVFRLRDRETLSKNYLLEFYESHDGKVLVKLVQVANGVKFKLGHNWKKDQLMYCLNKGIKQTILT